MRKIILIPEGKIPAALEELGLAMKEQQGTKLFVRYQVIYMLLFQIPQQHRFLRSECDERTTSFLLQL